MKEFAKFYSSLAWQKMQKVILERDSGLCVRCGQPGNIVNHKIHLTHENINNPEITLSADNLEMLCRDCYAREISCKRIDKCGR